MTSSGTKRQHGKSERPARNWALILIPIIGLGIVALLVVASRRERLNSNDYSAKSAAEVGQVMKSSGASGVAPDQVPIRSSLDRVPSRSASLSVVVPSESESAYTRQLVKSLSEVKLQGELTPEKAVRWQRNLEELIEQGTAAVAVLQEFFQRNEDVRFDSGSGANLLGEPTLRIAFLKVLFDIPTPENVELQEQVLRTSTDPDEIALLARQLDLQEPGTYREVIVEATKAALERAKSGELGGRDTSSLVKVLEQYGNIGVK